MEVPCPLREVPGFAESDALLVLSAPDGGVCPRATTPIFRLPSSPTAQPALSGGALAFSGGSQRLELSVPVLRIPLRSTTGFSAILTFQLTSMPGAADSTLLLLTGDTYTISVRVTAGTQTLQFKVDVGGGVTYTVASAVASVGPATWHTAVVRYEQETHKMQVWVDGVDSTQASVASTVCFAVMACVRSLLQLHSFSSACCGGHFDPILAMRCWESSREAYGPCQSHNTGRLSPSHFGRGMLVALIRPQSSEGDRLVGNTYPDPVQCASCCQLQQECCCCIGCMCRVTMRLLCRFRPAAVWTTLMPKQPTLVEARQTMESMEASGTSSFFRDRCPRPRCPRCPRPSPAQGPYVPPWRMVRFVTYPCVCYCGVPESTTP